MLSEQDDGVKVVQIRRDSSGLCAQDASGRSLRRAVQMACWLMSMTATGMAHAAIAQEPLIIKDKEAAEPNLMFVLDDSGSMMFNYLPDPNPQIIYSADCKPEARGGGCGEHEHIFAYHPGEPRSAWQDAYGAYPAEGLAGTDDKHLLGMRQRSAQVNGIYYDPETTYLPWVDENGKDMKNADPKAVIYHVGHPNRAYSELKLDITGEHATGVYKVCRAPRPPVINYGPQGMKVSEQPCDGDDSITSVAPATYYDLKIDAVKTAEARRSNAAAPPVYMAGDQVSHFTRVSIKDHQSFKRSASRTDCRVKGAPETAEVTCTQAQEYQNFANWFQYHRTRMLTAIAAVGRAFENGILDGDVRVGYGRINKAESSAVDGVNTAVIERGVRRFEGAGRASFFRWLNSQVGKGGTPLFRAMEAVGEYYKRADDQGPWSWRPGVGDGRPHLTCRRSFHILMTDGQYNEDPAKYKNIEADSNDGDLITGTGGKSYQYKPVAPYRGSVSGSLADLSAKYWREDLRPDLANEVKPTSAGKGGIDNPSFWQNMTTFTLGFGVEGTLKASDWPALQRGAKQWPSVVKKGSPEATDDLWHAGVNGRGGYLDVKNSSTFLSELQSILTKIKGVPGTLGGVTVPSRTLQAGNQKFVPSFRTRKGYGNLKAFELDENGVQGRQQWSAVKMMPEPARRRIYVGTGVGAAPAVRLLWEGALPAAVKEPLLRGAGLDNGNIEGKAKGAWLVDFLRGDGAQHKKLFRERPMDADEYSCAAPESDVSTSGTGGCGVTRINYLGHIVNSPPLYIGSDTSHGYQFLPATFPGDKNSGAGSYKAFVNSKKADVVTNSVGANGAITCRPNGHGRRPGLVFVGANDGFLHGFDAACGVERFAYAPHAVLEEMGRSSRKDFKPRYLMDGPLIEGDAYLNGKWANVLVGTTGAGPKAVFALNVTDTRAYDGSLGAGAVMWELDASEDRDLGHVLQQPEIGVLADGTWVVIFGNGYDSANGRAKLYVVSLETGRVLKRLDTPSTVSGGQSNGLGGVRLVRDGNQVISAVYAGDLNGNLWKFDLASVDSGDWKVALDNKPLFTTADRRPIVVAPTLVSHPLGGQMVLFGTGKLFEEGDNKPPKQGKLPVEGLYGIWDKAVLIPDADKGRLWQKEEQVTLSAVKTRKVVLKGNHATIPDTDSANQPLDWRRDRGWRIDQTMIASGGQRSIVPAQLFSGLALFETMTPLVNEQSLPCEDEVKTPAYSLVVDPLSGRMRTKALIDTDGNGRIDKNDQAVAGWKVENWTGRSAILADAPPEPCTTANCTQSVKPPVACEKNALRHVIQSVGGATVTCVNMPSPTRWWWRELTIRDQDYGTGKAADPAKQPQGGGSSNGS